MRLWLQQQQWLRLLTMFCDAGEPTSFGAPAPVLFYAKRGSSRNSVQNELDEELKFITPFFAFPWGKVPNECEADEGKLTVRSLLLVTSANSPFPSSVTLTRDSFLACRLGRRFCLRQRCPLDTRAPGEALMRCSLNYCSFFCTEKRAEPKRRGFANDDW